MRLRQLGCHLPAGHTLNVRLLLRRGSAFKWHYPYLDAPRRRWTASRLEFYSALARWGPWTLFYRQDFEPESWYNPCIPSKFISADGRHLWLFVAGNFIEGKRYYGLNIIPVTAEKA